MENPATERRTVHYAGRVQGVGFRYTVRQIAGSYAVTGFVQNLFDGRVRLVAEGELAELDGFLAEIAETMTDYIHRIEPFSSTATGEFDDFFIQR
jgi:acylphosphatase